MPSPRLTWFLASVLASTSAWAQPHPAAPSAAPAADAAPDEDEPPVPLVPPAADTLGGHFVLGLGAGLEAPFGELSQGQKAANLGIGFTGAADLGFGISRAVVLGAWGDFTSYGSKETGFAVGPFIRYHVVQGVRFDPWILAGPGYRSLTRETPDAKQQFSGVEILHVAVGGDYYPLSSIGFGPWLELDMGIYGKRPSLGTARVPPALHLGFVSGLRLVIDLPGK